MKKISTYLIAFSFGLLSLTACSGDDNTPGPEQQTNHLLGKWKLNTLSVKSYENGEVVMEFTDLPVQGQMTWEYDFKADNTVDYHISVPAQQLEEQGKGTYTKTGNTLTITIEEEPGTFVVSTLDADNLHLKMTEEGTAEGVTYKEEIEQKFVRN